MSELMPIEGNKGKEFGADTIKDNRNLKIIDLAVVSLHSIARILSRKEDQKYTSVDDETHVHF